MKNAFLVGPRVYFRPLEREDAPALASFVNHPEVRRTVLTHRPMSVGAEEAFLASLSSSASDIMFAIVLREGGVLLGATGLHKLEPRDRRAEFGLLIGARGHWGQGHGTEATRLMLDYAFGTLNLHKVTLEVFSNNPAGLRVYEKAGFTREGLLRQQHYVEGRYVDGIVMGMLREQWTPFVPPPAERPQSGTP
ncbi:GNAT family protein [Myxococcaceae bacterium GXIMD 01537]